LDVEGRVDDACKRLARYFNVGDFPKDKAARDAKIADLEKQKMEQAKKQADINPLIKSYRRQLTDLREELKRVGSASGLLEDFKKVLNSVEDDESTIENYKDGAKKIKDIGAGVSIPDYSLSGLFSVDSSGNLVDPTTKKTDSVKNLVTHANSFLDAMKGQDAATENFLGNEVEMDLTGDFSNEKYEYKTNLLGSTFSFNYCYLKVLRDIGADNLKNAIDSRSDLSTNIKDEMKKYVEEDLVKYIHRNEAITGDLSGDAGNEYDQAKREQ